MAGVIAFGDYREEPDVDSMNREELLCYLETVRSRIAQLDAREPEDMDSEEYGDWSDAHEELEDLADDAQDRLDELR
jgi:hypothetical protein